MGGGHRLILRDGEILIPKSLRKHMLQNLHITHCSDKLMLINAKRRIFWPDIKKDIRAFYESCPECLQYKQSKAQAGPKVSYENLYMHFEPGMQIQADFCQYRGQDSILISCEISGLSKVSKTENKSTQEALRVLKEWNSVYGNPYFVKCDGGPSYRDEFKQECKAMEIVFKTSSSYNSQSKGLIERQVGIFKADYPIAGIEMWMLEI